VVDSPPNPETPNLSSETFVSSIPKAGAHKEYWIYPSDQRWYNAAKKKEEKFQADFSITPDEKLTEDAVPAAVYIHNHLNEQAWKEILEYENFFKDSEPKLKSFRGRAKDFTPKARLFHLLGLAPLPFDRHDWIIESEGVERKYVIDYYSDLKEEQALGVPVIYMDVRPCALSPWGLINRVRIFIKTKRGEA
jgi:cytochrome c heme-lyase